MTPVLTFNVDDVQTVNFYGDAIDVAREEDGQAYVSLSQITGYLGMNHDDVISIFENNDLIEILSVEGNAIVRLNVLPSLLVLLPYELCVDESAREDLYRYQKECFQVLNDYWYEGVAVNRRETPYDIGSKFKDERVISRPALIKAIAKLYKGVDGADESGLKQDLFDKVLAKSYAIIGLEPLHEFEKLSGSQAMYLAWVENIFASVINKFATWEEIHEDVIEEADAYVRDHLRATGAAWLTMADNVPASMYR